MFNFILLEVRYIAAGVSVWEIHLQLSSTRLEIKGKYFSGQIRLLVLACFVVSVVMLTFGELSNDSFKKDYNSDILTLSDCPVCFGALLMALGLKS